MTEDISYIPELPELDSAVPEKKSKDPVDHSCGRCSPAHLLLCGSGDCNGCWMVQFRRVRFSIPVALCELRIGLGKHQHAGLSVLVNCIAQPARLGNEQ